MLKLGALCWELLLLCYVSPITVGEHSDSRTLADLSCTWVGLGITAAAGLPAKCPGLKGSRAGEAAALGSLVLLLTPHNVIPAQRRHPGRVRGRGHPCPTCSWQVRPSCPWGPCCRSRFLPRCCPQQCSDRLICTLTSLWCARLSTRLVLCQLSLSFLKAAQVPSPAGATCQLPAHSHCVSAQHWAAEVRNN